MYRMLICAHCGRRITSRENLVTALMLFSIVPYHGACYAKALRGCQSVVLGNEPINGIGFTVGAAFAGVASIWAGFAVSWIMGVLFLLPAGIRLYSWFALERQLE